MIFFEAAKWVPFIMEEIMPQKGKENLTWEVAFPMCPW